MPLGIDGARGFRRPTNDFRASRTGLALVLREPAAGRTNPAGGKFFQPFGYRERDDSAIYQAAAAVRPRPAAPLFALMLAAGAGEAHPVLDRNAALRQFVQQLGAHRHIRTEVSDLTRR